MLAAAGTAWAAPTTYALDSNASQLTVQVFKDASALSDFAHDHVILATGWSGSTTLEFDEDGAVQSCDIGVDVPVSGLRPDIPDIREAFGMRVMLTDAQQVQVGEHMRGEDQLDASNHTSIRFEASTCKGSLDALQVDGSLTVRGQKKAVSFTFAGSIEEDTLSGRGGFSLQHADFGFSPYTAFLGTLRNREELRFVLQVVGKAQ